MKISINDVKFTPSHLEFGICVFGQPTESVQNWIDFWQLQTVQSEDFTNIILPFSFPVADAFHDFYQYEFVDGFSPNLNKHLHVGHLSNFIYAKAFQSLKIGKHFVAVLGDTLEGEVSKEEAFQAYRHTIERFEYEIAGAFFASTLRLGDSTMLVNGTDKYADTRIVEVGNDKVVVIKSDGTTTYFYQDMAVAQHLQAPTLYLTGSEQSIHFELLKKLYPQISHIGLGLVMLDGKKMSSSEGNVVYMEELFNQMLPNLSNDINLVWNVLAGMILRSEPSSIKKIDTKSMTNASLSPGMYISYTMAKMHSAGIKLNKVFTKTYYSLELELKSLKAKTLLKPNIFMTGIIAHCKKINQLYTTHYIKDNPVNELMFQLLTDDLLKAVNEIGMFPVYKVDKLEKKD